MREFQFRKLRRSQLLAGNSTTRQLDPWPEATRRRFGRFYACRKVGPPLSVMTAHLPMRNLTQPPSSPIPLSPSLAPFLDRLFLSFPSFPISFLFFSLLKINQFFRDFFFKKIKQHQLLRKPKIKKKNLQIIHDEKMIKNNLLPNLNDFVSNLNDFVSNLTRESQLVNQILISFRSCTKKKKTKMRDEEERRNLGKETKKSH